MNFDDWIAQPGDRSVALVIGGGYDVLWRVLFEFSEAWEVICASALAREVAMAAGERFRNTPRIAPLRRLPSDLVALAQSPGARSLLVAEQTLDEHVRAHGAAWRRRAEVIAGYAPPLAPFETAAAAEMGEALSECARAGRRRVVAQAPRRLDAVLRPGLSTVDGVTVFDPEDAVSSPAPEEAAAPPGRDQIVAFARYLAQAELRDLSGLCAQMPASARAAAGAVWRADLATLSADPALAPTAAAALRRLDEALAAP